MGSISSRLGNGIDFSRSSEALLTNVSDEIHGIAKNNAREAEVAFKLAIKWKSDLSASDFSDPFFVTEGQLVKSAEKKKDGQPVFTFEKGTISVHTFGALSKVLSAAQTRKLTELRKALEANREPLANILGSAYSGTVDLISAHDKMAKDDSGNADSEAQFRLLLLLQSIDIKLMQSSVQQLSKEVRLNMETASAELKLLQTTAGIDSSNSLDSIDWESSFEFSNGYRAPPWRQVHGDLGYITVKPKDGDGFTVAANLNGFWLVKGLAGSTMDYSQSGDAFPTLVSLLKTKSAHFAATIDKQDFKYTSKETIKENSETAAKPVSDNQKTKKAQLNTTAQTSTKKKTAAEKLKNSLQPSPKWANLGLTETMPSSAIKATTKKQAPAERTGSGTQSHKSQANFSASDTDDEEEEVEERKQAIADLPPEYWSIQKLVKYLSGGNQTATIIALCSLRDFDLTSDTCQFAIRDVGGLDVLVNLLETEDVKCKIGALLILKDISLSAQVKKSIADLDGIRPLVAILEDANEQLKCLAALTIANCAKYGRNRRMVRQYGGIDKLVALLKNKGSATGENEVARCGALALWSCSKSSKNKDAILKSGAVQLLEKLLKSENTQLLIPVVGILEVCAEKEEFRKLICAADMIDDFVRNLSLPDVALQTHSATAIFRCGQAPETRVLVRKHGGLKPLVTLASNPDANDLLWGATGAIWKCAQDPENVQELSGLRAVETLVALLNNQPEDVLINVVGALSELASEPKCGKAIRSTGGIDPLVNLLTGTNQSLLLNVTKAIGKCAADPESMAIIDKLDGVRLLWSLLKSSNKEVQASAAWAICPCIENAKDAGEMVRSFVGGLELVVGLLKSDNVQVLASVCAAIANIAKDSENLAIITDHGVVPMLGKLAGTSDDTLRRHLAEAIAHCCAWGNNRAAFGDAGAVAPLVKYLNSSDPLVHRATARALNELSVEPHNCVTMHANGVVRPLLDMVGSDDTILQEAAASCLANIRRLALATEKARAN